MQQGSGTSMPGGAVVPAHDNETGTRMEATNVSAGLTTSDAPNGQPMETPLMSENKTMNETTMQVENAPQEAAQQETAQGTPTVEAVPATTTQARADESTQATNGKRMLYRHPTDRVLGGVCSGLADFTGLDVGLVRILWVVATVATGGGGILAYAALWLLLPVGTVAEGRIRPPALEINHRNLGRAAIALIALGVIWLLANLGVLPWLWNVFTVVMSLVFWPLLLIGVGYLILRHTGRGELKWDWRKSAAQAKNQVGERMPSRESMRERMAKARANFPIKRSRTDRIFMGVCGGIGKRIGIDANLVRLVWAAFSVGSIGAGVLIYVLAGLFLPEEPLHPVGTDEEGRDVQVIDVKTTQV